MFFSKLIFFEILLLINCSSVASIVHFNLHQSKLEIKPSSLISLETSLGTVIGYEEQVQNKTINVFYGLPYAEAPIGKLRFRKSKLIQKFPYEPYEALEFKPHCPLLKNNKKFDSTDLFDEDCLYMNIWTPNLEKINGECKKKYNVMIFIHGSNSSIYQIYPMLDENKKAHLSYSGKLFAALHDTILVIFNYRDRLFSTMYLKDEFPANLALFDQNLAIEWTNQYIGDFCGDQKLTLFGQSFGANFLSIQLMSKYSKNLINNAILMSGFPLFNDMFPVTKNEQLINTLLVTDSLNCLNLKNSTISENVQLLNGRLKRRFFDFYEGKYHLKSDLFITELRKNLMKTDKKLKKQINYVNDDYIERDVLELAKHLSKLIVDIKCLEQVTIEQMISLDPIHYDRGWQIMYDFDFIDQATYLNYKLYDKLNVNPEVNLLIGGLVNEKYELPLKEKYYTDQFNAPVVPKEDAKESIAKLIDLFNDDHKLASKLANYYTNESKWRLPNGYFDSFTNLKTEYEYKCSYYFYSGQVSKSASKVFNYINTKLSTKHFGLYVEYDLDDFTWLDTVHADDLIYLFGLPYRLKNQFNDLDREFASKLLNLFVYFSKHSKMYDLDSGKKWPVSNKYHPKPRYVEINDKYLRERKFEFEERCEEFWRPLLPFYKK